MARRNREVGQLSGVGGNLITLPGVADLSVFYTDFDGTADYISAGDVFNKTRFQRFSLSFWLNKTGSHQAHLAGRAQSAAPFRGFSVREEFGGEVSCRITNTRGSNEIDQRTTGFSFTAGAWTHVCVTYAGTGAASGVTIYGNGADVTAPTPAADTLSATIQEANARFTVGAAFDTVNGAGDGFYPGNMADVRFFDDSELSAAQVTELYNAGMMLNNADHSAGGFCELWYRMGDGDAGQGYDSNSILDWSGFGNDGTSVSLTSADVIDGTAAASWPDRTS